jgi:hypothetical protein
VRDFFRAIAPAGELAVLSVRCARQATRIAASKEIAGGSKRKRYGFLADVKVRNPALSGCAVYGRDADTLRGQMVCEVQCDIGGNIHENDICRGHRYRQAWKFRQTLRERLGIRMIVSEPIDMVFQRIKTRRSENPCLPQAAAKHLAQAPCFGDKCRRTNEHRSCWRAESFGKAYGHGVKRARQHADRKP